MTESADSKRASWSQRDLRFDPTMSSSEALMWRLEGDPWLAPSGGMLILLDAPLDVDAFRCRIVNATARLPRLRERVINPVLPLGRPTWRTDRELELDHHFRTITVPGPGTRRQLFDLAVRLMADPFDRTRPLWRFYAIDGLDDGRGAVFAKLHHSITDGNGAMRLAEMYMELDPDAPVPPEIDLDEVIRADREREDAAAEAAGSPSVTSVLSSSLKTGLGLARNVAGELALITADPMRVVDTGTATVATARESISELVDGGGGEGSPLWMQRSRHRHLEGLRVPLDDVKTAAKALGGTINDVFVTAVAVGADRYHAERGAEHPTLNLSFIVSTHSGEDSSGANSFSPTIVQSPGGELSVRERFDALHAVLAERRAAVISSGGMAAAAALAPALPTRLVAKVGRDQAGRIDLATSNFRGAPFTVYMSGSAVLENYTLGPVAGTAGNITVMSYDGSLDIGMMLDPVAVADPADLRDHIERAFADLIAEGRADTRSEQ